MLWFETGLKILWSVSTIPFDSHFAIPANTGLYIDTVEIALARVYYLTKYVAIALIGEATSERD
jgi:hypothetical protein